MKPSIQPAKAFLLLFALAAAGARENDLPLAQVLKWRSIGPYRGGRVTAVAGVLHQPLVYYMGATGGGVWKTENAGVSWRPVSDAYFKTGSVGSIAVADSNPNMLYVGMGEACLRSNISQGDGVYKSTDAGKTWVNVGLRDTQQIGRVRIDPKDPNLVYVAAIGHPYGPNQERGVFRTKDGGKTWEKILYVNEKTGAVDLELDPRNPRILYAATWQVVRAPWGITSTGPGSGIYKSTDGGDHWSQLTNGLPHRDKGKIGIAVSNVNPQRVWATVESEDGGGIYRTDDAGQSWQLLNDHFEVRGRQYYYGHIFADPQELDTVYTFSSKGFFKSTDGGKTYTTLRAPHGDYHDLWIDPENRLRMVNGNDGGGTVSVDGGNTWSSLDNQPTAQFYEVITDNHFPYRIYGSQQDNTTVSIASRTESGGIDVTDWYPVGGGESGYIAPDPENPEITYGGSYFGALTRYDHAANQLRNITIWPDYPGGRVAADVKYRFQWTYPIVIPPLDPKAILAGGNRLFRSVNQGESWEPISPDLTRDDKTREHGGRLEEYYSTIFAIAASRLDKNVIWTGSDDGLIHVTQNAGKNWRNVTPDGLPEWSRINNLEASPHSASAAYAAVNRYQLDDRRPFIYKTSDFGKSWKLITAGIPQDTFVRTVREDPVRKGLLFAGTETGVYVSWNDGAEWRPLQLNLPIVPITDLTIKDGDLIASTQGRAFWVLDDITVLRQLAGDELPSAAKLFKPRDVYRPGRRMQRIGGGAAGQNPPSGLLVTYYFPAEPKQPVTLEFAEASGKKIIQIDKAPAAAGLNRFEWDLRYPSATGIQGGTYLAGGSLRGPVAVPGKYRVRLTSAGETQEQDFEILADPRVRTTPEEYKKQFDLLISVRDQLSAANEAFNRLQPIEQKLKARNDPHASELASQLDELAHELAEPAFTGFDDQMLVFPLKLNNRIAALQGYVEGPFAPTRQDLEVFYALSAELEGLLSRIRKTTAQAAAMAP